MQSSIKNIENLDQLEIHYSCHMKNANEKCSFYQVNSICLTKVKPTCGWIIICGQCNLPGRQNRGRVGMDAADQ